jgi:hypothetical protein
MRKLKNLTTEEVFAGKGALRTWHATHNTQGGYWTIHEYEDEADVIQHVDAHRELASCSFSYLNAEFTEVPERPGRFTPEERAALEYIRDNCLEAVEFYGIKPSMSDALSNHVEKCVIAAKVIAQILEEV